MTGDPFESAAVHPIVMRESVLTAVRSVGASGAAAGVTPAVGDEASPVPIAFVAVTMNVYVEPLVTPVMSQETEVVVQVSEGSSTAVTV